MMKKFLGYLLVFSILSVFVLSLSAAPTAVGADKCAKMCHKVQYESWAKSKHATQEPKVDCEGCHGNGSDYNKMSVMKDLAAAKAAGLIAVPEKASCTAKCHKANFKDEMLKTAHDHKAK
jgi:hypothetical protein